MTTRKITTAKDAAQSAPAADLRRIVAYQKVFSGQGSREDADIVMSDMAALTGFFRPPNYAQWMQKTGTPQGFELHCALHAARAEPLRRILDSINMTDAQILELEKAARKAR